MGPFNNDLTIGLMGIQWKSILEHILVGGLDFLFSIIYGLSSFPLTNSYIFQDG